MLLSAALCALLCLPAALQAAQAPIRIIGSLGTSPPVAPHDRSWNSLVPCSTITDTGRYPCNRAGYPATKAWMANLSSDARGTVKFMTPDYRSRTVLAHPDGLMLNHAVWQNLGIDFVTMRNDYMHVSGKTESDLVNFMSEGTYPWVVSDYGVNSEFPYVSDLLDAMHIKVVDGVSIGTLVLWPGMVRALPLARVLPHLTRRLRKKGADKIVVFLSGFASKGGMEPVSTPATAVMIANDVDVVVRDIAPDAPPFVQNGTTVLTAAPYTSASNNLLVLEMVQGGSPWQYSLREISLLDTPVPFYDDPVYLAAKQWMQVEIDRSVSNDVTITQLTAPMPKAAMSPGVYWCDGPHDCEVGVLTADAMRESAGTELALVNAAGARAGMGWPVGPVKRSTLWATYPFANQVCIVNVSATLLVSMLNYGINNLLASGAQNSSMRQGSYPQISGFRFSLNPQLPVGSRVVSVDVMQPDGTFAPLQKRRVYSLAVSSYFLTGGDIYTMLPGRHHGPSKCLVTTMMEATQEYLMRRQTYAPYTDRRTVLDFNGMALPMRNQSLADCSDLEKHDPFWEDCVPCDAGFWRPDALSNVCIEKLSDSVSVFMIAGIVVGAVLVLAIPLVWKMTEKQRHINALYNNNKVAEECAVAVMELRLSDLDYLNKLEKPNAIQAAFIAIVKQMKVYMEFMPKNMIANYMPSEAEATAAEGPRESVVSFSDRSTGSTVRSLSASRRAAASLRNDATRQKRVTVLALNSRSHTANCGLLDSNGVRELHSHLIETFNNVVETFKGLAESMCGDRLLAAWNTVVDRASHSMLACKAAYQMRECLTEGAITAHVGLATGSATFGLFGATGTKKYDIVGRVVPAAMLLALLNKEYNTRCLFPQSMLHDAGLLFYVYVVDYISHPKVDASFIYGMGEERRGRAD